MYLPNIDTLQFSLDFLDYNKTISEYRELLEEKKSLAQSYRSDFSNEKALVDICGVTFEVLPNGAKGYAYILHNSDYEINLAMARSSQKDNYPVFVRIKQPPLWSKGIYGAYGYIIHWLKSMFGIQLSEKLNRVDLCCHTDTIAFQNYDLSFFRTRATKKNVRVHGNTINGFEFGTRKGSLIYCRVYNKTLEVTESKKALWFFDIWQSKNADKSNVWNIEFELKRSFFKEHNIETLTDFINNAASIWEYLTGQWLVLCIKNHSRLENCAILNEWEALMSNFFLNKYDTFIRKNEQLQTDSKTLIAQMLGYIRTYAALEEILDLRTALERIYADVNERLYETNKSFEHLVNEKAVLYVRG